MRVGPDAAARGVTSWVQLGSRLADSRSTARSVPPNYNQLQDGPRHNREDCSPQVGIHALWSRMLRRRKVQGSAAIFHALISVSRPCHTPAAISSQSTRLL